MVELSSPSRKVWVVLEHGVDPLFRCQPPLDGEIPAIQPERIFRQREVHVRREEAAIPIRPSAEFGVRKTQIAGVLALDVQLQFVVVLIGNRPRVQRQRGGLVEIGSVMEALDSAKSPAQSVAAVGSWPVAAGKSRPLRIRSSCCRSLFLPRTSAPGSWERGGRRRRLVSSRRDGWPRHAQTEQPHPTP